MSYNQVILVGHVTRDPELRFTPKGTAITQLGLALNRVWTDDTGQKKEEVTFVDVTVWGKTAENCGQYLRKGSQALVSGRLKNESWDDKQTGQKRHKLAVVAETVQFLGGKPEAEPARERHGSGKPSAAKPAPAVAGDEPDDSDPVPF